MVRLVCSGRRVGLATVALIAIILSQPPSQALARSSPAVIDAHVALHERTTRFVVGLTHPVPFQVSTLTNPSRVIIDLSSVEWQPPMAALPTKIGLVDTLHHRLLKLGTFRIVLNCNAPAKVNAAFLMRPTGSQVYQLVVDLIPKSPPVVAPALVAGTPLLGSRPAISPRSLDTGRPAVASLAPAALALASPPRKPQAAPNQYIAPNHYIVVLDPGHGGEDPGAISTSGIREKDITLATARVVRDQLQRLKSYKVVLTRDRDVFIPLRDRVTLARAAGADMFVSIHADATDNRATRGLSVYTLSEQASDAEAAALAERENKADLISGVNFSDKTREVANILIDLAQRDSMNQSARLASLLVNRLQAQTQLLRNTHRFAGFAVLKAPDVPSVLIELGYLSNPHEERMLQSKPYQNKLARAISEAIKNYFGRVEEASTP